MKNSIRFLFIASLALGLLTPARADVETYAIDPVHSSAGFTLRHIVSKFTGSFTNVTGTILVDRANMENNSVEAVVDVGSVNTANDKRNDHLKGPEFFDLAKYATMTFKSTAWKKTGDDTYDVTGNLTIKDVTKSVVLKVTSLGFAPGRNPSISVSGWEATTTIHKADFGLSGSAILGKILGDDVSVTIGVEAKSPPPAPAQPAKT